jgi:hypothetical protein
VSSNHLVQGHLIPAVSPSAGSPTPQRTAPAPCHTLRLTQRGRRNRFAMVCDAVGRDGFDSAKPWGRLARSGRFRVAESGEMGGGELRAQRLHSWRNLLSENPSNGNLG